MLATCVWGPNQRELRGLSRAAIVSCVYTNVPMGLQSIYPGWVRCELVLGPSPGTLLSHKNWGSESASPHPNWTEIYPCALGEFSGVPELLVCALLCLPEVGPSNGSKGLDWVSHPDGCGSGCCGYMRVWAIPKSLLLLQILIRNRATDLDARMHDGTTPLILTARLAVEGMLEELITSHADVNAVDDLGEQG